jgi:ketosteroid isomerase-like protein
MTLYDHLEVPQDADVETIRQAIARQSATWGRRVGASATLRTKHEAENMMQVLADARHKLLDAERRREYDATLAPALPSGARQGGGAGRPAGRTSSLEPRPASSADLGEKACPFCGETIKVQAIKCRHCGEFLDDSVTRAQVSQVPPPSGPAVRPPQVPPPPAPARQPASSDSSGIAVLFGVALVLGLGFVAVSAISKKAPEPTPTPVQEAVAPTPEPSYYQAPVEEPSPAVVMPDQAEITGFLQNWAEAWSSLDVDRYIQYYDSNFSGRDLSGETYDYAGWYRYKKQIAGKKSWVRITIAGNVEISGDSSLVTVEFNQLYESSNYSDRTRKLIQLVQQDGTWKIVREEALRKL